MTYAIGVNLPTCSHKACCQPSTTTLDHEVKDPPESLPVAVDYCAEHAFHLQMLAMHGLPTTLAAPKGKHDA